MITNNNLQFYLSENPPMVLISKKSKFFLGAGTTKQKPRRQLVRFRSNINNERKQNNRSIPSRNLSDKYFLIFFTFEMFH